MGDMEKTVEMQDTDAVQDDAVQEVAEEKSGTPLSEVLGAEEPAEQPDPATEPGKKPEPGWMQKTREAERQKGYNQAKAEFEAWKAGFIQEQEAQIAPLRELAMEREAEALVASGKVADKETALELVRLRKGMPVQPEKPEQPRDTQGRFAKPDAPVQDAEVRARAELLNQQAQDIAKRGGPDMLALFREDETVKNAVLVGADFEAVYALLGRASAKTPRVPGVVRAPNHTKASRSFHDMSDAEFAKFNASLDAGKTYDARE